MVLLHNLLLALYDTDPCCRKPEVIMVMLKLMVDCVKGRTPLQVDYTREVKMLHCFIQIYLQGKDDKHH